jgi:serine phosphatase RsbU (regulator of sigma subunit)
VASGMMVSITKTALNGLSTWKPNLMLNKLNAVIKKVDLGIIRMSLNVIEFGKNEFTLSSAAMPPIYFFNAKEGKLEEFSNNGLPLGSFRNELYALETRKFRKGDVLVQFSDGLPEAPNLSNELYDYERMKSVVENSCHLSAQEIINTLITSVDEWMQGRPNPDDITIVVTKKK